MELGSRSFSANSLSTRLRPKEYKKIPESTLNATLKDIHDLIQYAVVQAQRIVFGQDLDKTFAVSCVLPLHIDRSPRNELWTDEPVGFPWLHRLVLAN